MNCSRHAYPKRPETWWIFPLLMLFFLGSCATTTRETVNPAPNSHWVKVRSSPPTWYPCGTRSDCPTDMRSGEWVVAGDREGSRFFIPFHVSGEVPRKTLVKEALRVRGPDVPSPATGEQCASLGKLVGNIVLGPPLFIMTLYGAKYGPSHDKLKVDRKSIFPFDP